MSLAVAMYLLWVPQIVVVVYCALRRSLCSSSDGGVGSQDDLCLGTSCALVACVRCRPQSSLINPTSMSDSDDIVFFGRVEEESLPAQPAPRGPKRRIDAESYDFNDSDLVAGPLQVVAVCGSSDGHHATDLPRHCGRLCRNLLVRERSALDMTPYKESCVQWQRSQPKFLGFVLMHRWHFVSSPGRREFPFVSVDFQRAVHAMTIPPNKKSRYAIVDYPILEAAFASTPLELSGELVASWKGPIASQVCCEAVDNLIVNPVERLHHPDYRDYEGRVIGTPINSRTLFGRWRQKYDLNDEHLMPFPVFWFGPLAEVMVQGAWRLACSFISKRKRASLLPACSPGRLCLHAYWLSFPTEPADLDVVDEGVDGGVGVTITKRVVGRSQRFSKYDLGHVINALRATRHLRSVGCLKDTAHDMFHFGFPNRHEELSNQFDEDVDCPGMNTLLRARVRLDAAACMHHRREVQSFCKDVDWIYLAFDASPQGLEVFAGRQRVIRNLVYTLPMDSKLPLTTLSHGRAGTIDKDLAVHHIVFLIAGPSVKTMERYCCSVRCVLSDLGVEWEVGETPNFMVPYLTNRTDPNTLDKCRGTYLFPFAIRVPGPQHLWDWICKEVVLRFLVPAL